MTKLFHKRRDQVEAMQFNGQNATEIVTWAQGGWRGRDPLAPTRRGGGIYLKQTPAEGQPMLAPGDEGDFVWSLVIPAGFIHGFDVEAKIGDWILKVPPRDDAEEVARLRVMTPAQFVAMYEPAK